ncbi:MAG TPA: hypothetical protein VEI83_13155 [Acidimicrobiales bacterium]|nr:hypothetical protein [Acidimicrobiales bacterium]
MTGESAVLALVALVVALAAAVRSTWSPCGLSMLSTITPLGESGRGRRFAATAAWFVAGAVLGGMCLGALGAALAASVGALHLPAATRIALGAAGCAWAASADAGARALAVPVHHRQVNERWLDHFRPWVYGMGFGWQIGVGLATYIMTAGVYLLVLLGALSASPLAAFGVATAFGTVRGVAVLLGRGIRDPETLRAFHRRFAAIGPWSRRAVTGVELGAALVLLALVWWPAAAGAALAAVVVVRARLGRRHGLRVARAQR